MVPADAAERAVLATEADLRARQVLADADAAGRTLLDPIGRRRSPATLSQYRKGVPAANRGRKLPPEVLTSEEVFALMRACGGGPAGRRNRALIAIGARAGLRCAEALDLYPKDVDLDRGHVRVLHGKGNKARTVGLDPGACAIVHGWMIDRHELGLNGSYPLFCVIKGPTRGGRLSGGHVRSLMHDLAVKAGIEKRVHYHGLRHTYAAYLLDHDVPIHYIRRMLGHASIEVTARYADHINPAVVVDAVRALHWPEDGVEPTALPDRCPSASPKTSC